MSAMIQDDNNAASREFQDAEGIKSWPPSVLIFHAKQTNEEINAMINALSVILPNNQIGTYADLKTVKGHFSPSRFAFFFSPGTYQGVSVDVAYYVQVLGLGVDLTDLTQETKATKFVGGRGIYSLPVYPRIDPGSLDNFWRGAENFINFPEITDNDTYPGTIGQYKSDHDLQLPRGMLWAVSQAAPIRRIVTDSLFLNFCGFFASGGFMSNININIQNTKNVSDFRLGFGSQQQWFARNCEIPQNDVRDTKIIERVDPCAWNTVFVGCTNNPLQVESGTKLITSIHTTPLICEKPFISVDPQDFTKYQLQVPKPRVDSIGVDHGTTNLATFGFDKVYVVTTEIPDYSKIQGALDNGHHVIFSPGVYYLPTKLVVVHPDQVILGIGMASLVAPPDGTPCIVIKQGLTNVRIAGLTLQASAIGETLWPGSCLLLWGEEKLVQHVSDPLTETNLAGVLSDIFVRVGGPDTNNSVGVETMIRINSDYVIGDNLWLWRADHTLLLATDTQNYMKTPNRLYHRPTPTELPCSTCLEVNGNFVNMYGLFCEHVFKDQVVWNGEHGSVYFYQCELPYEVSQDSFAKKGYAGFRVADTVQHFNGWGMGVYSNFRDEPVYVPNAFVTPDAVSPNMVNVFTKFLDPRSFGGIMAVHNNQGKSVYLGSIGTDASAPMSDISACSHGKPV